MERNMRFRDRPNVKSFLNVLFVLLCIGIVVGIMAIGIWIGVTFWGMRW